MKISDILKNFWLGISVPEETKEGLLEEKMENSLYGTKKEVRQDNETTNLERIEEAKKLLVEMDEEPILNIINRIGYKEKSSFYRHFKFYVGCTPSQWRECHGNKKFLNEK